MSNTERAFIAGFIKAASDPAFFEPYYKDNGITTSPLSLLTGYVAPIKGARENVYDAMLRRQNDLNKLDIAGNALSTGLGMNRNSPLINPLAYYATQPNNYASKILSPLLGGDPVKANISSYNSLKGAGGLGS
jgi:hypothetical protein